MHQIVQPRAATSSMHITLDDTLGALFSSTLIGIWTYPRDSSVLKLTILLIMALDTASVVLNSEAIYNYVIRNYGNLLSLERIDVTDTVLDKLMIFAINRGMMNIILHIVLLATFISMDNLIWTYFHASGARVYTISILSMLNRRTSMSPEHSDLANANTYGTPPSTLVFARQRSDDATKYDSDDISGIALRALKLDNRPARNRGPPR
ncbi:hypothetical protein HGRIS_003487 [Hohenbuehelia grisea]|uniref:DUF6534 domain-containing protein n=1 Tax=Hohenbuehelia grisea TaxID=104357 RepID=A0ABR3JHA1_9AGAR